MKIFLRGEQAFVKVGDNAMLCIGTRADVDAATAAHKLTDLVNLAAAIYRFQNINWRHATRH